MPTRHFSIQTVHRIVDRFHVSASEEDITSAINNRIENAILAGTPWTPAQRRLAIRDALSRHRQNIKLYMFVQRGHR